MKVDDDYLLTMAVLKNDYNHSIYLCFNFSVIVSNFYQFIFAGVHRAYDWLDNFEWEIYC